MSILLWNFVNLIDAEGGWLLQLLLFFIVAAVLTRLLGKACAKFATHTKGLQRTLIVSLYTPIVSLIWFFVLLFSANLVTDGYISQQFPSEMKMLQHATVVLIGAWFLMRWKRAILQVVLEKRPVEEHGKIMGISKLVTALIIVFTALLLMETTGQSIATLIAFGGISGLALAIASQEIVANFFGGFMVYINTPFQVHDTISVPSSGIEGVVEEIGWYETVMHGKDMRPMYVPNSLFTKATIINQSRMQVRKISESIHLRHEDLQKVPAIRTTVVAFLKQHPSILADEKIDMHIEEISLNCLDITIQAMTPLTKDEPYFHLRDELFLKVGEFVNQAGAKFYTSLYDK